MIDDPEAVEVDAEATVEAVAKNGAGVGKDSAVEVEAVAIVGAVKVEAVAIGGAVEVEAVATGGAVEVEALV